MCTNCWRPISRPKFRTYKFTRVADARRVSKSGFVPLRDICFGVGGRTQEGSFLRRAAREAEKLVNKLIEAIVEFALAKICP